MDGRPQVRSDGVVVETLGDGVVLYDSDTKQAHSLDADAARVWTAADGERTVADVAAAAELNEAVVVAALHQLGARGLLVEQSGVSRRWMLRRAAVVGAAAFAAAPLIETVIIPTAAAHASTGPTGGQGGNGSGVPPGTQLVATLRSVFTQEVEVTMVVGPDAGRTFLVAPDTNYHGPYRTNGLSDEFYLKLGFTAAGEDVYFHNFSNGGGAVYFISAPPEVIPPHTEISFAYSDLPVQIYATV